VLEGQLITNKINIPATEFITGNGCLLADLKKDLLYMVVVNRYRQAPASKCFVKNFGLTRGAIASSVAHDSHNIIAVGADLTSVERAVNLIIASRGGVCSVMPLAGNGDYEEIHVPLPIAGLMSDKEGYEVAATYSAADALAKKMGSRLAAPFMSLSFMALLVIPHLKLSDLGLFDGDEFRLLTNNNNF
jgi:adenine deaminase